MRLSLVLFALCLYQHGVHGQDWKLIWSDEFDGDSIDPTKWDHEVSMFGGGNSEFQTYTDDTKNSYVRDGFLWLKPTLLRDNIDPLTGEPYGDEVFSPDNTLDLVESYGRCTPNTYSVGEHDDNSCVRTGREIPPIASARVRSFERFAFKYGRVEISARMPVGDWLWPAMWFLPEQFAFGEWPESGEIDLVEIIGNLDYVCNGNQYKDIRHMGTAMHWGTSRQDNRFYLTQDGKDNVENDYGNNFHEYVLEWSSNGVKFIIDGDLVMSRPDPLIDENENWTGFYDFGAPWDFDPGNIWANPDIANDPLMAPFDQEMHFLLNVAVGGTNGFIPDDCVNAGGDASRVKTFRNGMTQVEGMNAFYDFRNGNNNDGWYSTWLNGDESVSDRAAMQVDYIRVYQQD